MDNSLIWECENDDIYTHYKNQDITDKPFQYYKTFEIYNYKYNIWEVYVPSHLNYIRKHIDDRYIATAIYYDVKKYTSKVKGLLNEDEYKIYKSTNQFNGFRIPFYNMNDFNTDNLEDIKTVFKKYKNGYFYTTTRKEFIKNNTIKIRPIINTTAYTFIYDPSMIYNNYWVKKNDIKIIDITV